MTTVHEFKRNNLYRIDTTDGEAFAVSVQIDDDELLELCRIIVGVDLNSYRVYDVEDGGECSDDDDVTEYGVSYMKNNHEEFSHVYNLSDEESDDFSPDGTVLSTLKHIRDGGKVMHYGFWCCDDDSVVTLDDAIRFVERHFLLNYLRYAPSDVLSDFMGDELPNNMFQFELEQHLADKIDHMKPDEFDEKYSEWETKTDNFSTYHF